MTADEILKLDTEKMSLNKMVGMLDSNITRNPALFGEEVYKLRRRHEIDTGIPMEEDCFGEQEAEMKRSLGLRFEDDEGGDDSEGDEA